MTRLMNAIPTLVLLLGLLVAWELIVRAAQVPAYLVPAPSAIGARWLRDPLFFVVEGGISLSEALAGLAVGGGLAFLAGGVLIAALLTFFPVLIGVVSGLRSPPAAARDVLATLHAGVIDEIVLLRLPAALPHLFAAVKVSATLALLGAVIAEWIGGGRGLGRAILLANSNLDTTTSLAGVMTLAAIGVGLVGGVAMIERRAIFL